MKKLFLILKMTQLTAYAGPLQDYINASPENFCQEALTHLKTWSCLYHSEIEKAQLILEKAKFCAQHNKIQVLSDGSNDVTLRGEIKIIGSFSPSEPKQTCTVHYNFTPTDAGPHLDHTYTHCEFPPTCNEKSQRFDCHSENSEPSKVVLTPQRLYFSKSNFIPAGLITDKSPALPYAINQNSVFYSWNYNPDSTTDTLESNSVFDVQRTLFKSGQGTIFQSWTYGCFGEMCSGFVDRGIKTWQCSRIK